MESDWEDDLAWATVNPAAREFDQLFAHLSDKGFARLVYSQELARRLVTIAPFYSFTPSDAAQGRTEEDKAKYQQRVLDAPARNLMLKTASRPLFDFAIEMVKKQRVVSAAGRLKVREWKVESEKLGVAGRHQVKVERQRKPLSGKRRRLPPGVGVRRKVSKNGEVMLGIKLTGGEFVLGPHESLIKLDEDPTTPHIPHYSARLEFGPSLVPAALHLSLADVLAIKPDDRSAAIFPQQLLGIAIRAQTLPTLPPSVPQPLRLHDLPFDIPLSYHLRDSPVPIEPTKIMKNERLHPVDLPVLKSESAARHLRDASLLAVTPFRTREPRTPAQIHPQPRRTSSSSIVKTSPSASESTAPVSRKRQSSAAPPVLARPYRAEIYDLRIARGEAVPPRTVFKPNPKARDRRASGYGSSVVGGVSGVTTEEMEAAKAKQIEVDRLRRAAEEEQRSVAIENERLHQEELDLRALEAVAKSKDLDKSHLADEFSSLSQTDHDKATVDSARERALLEQAEAAAATKSRLQSLLLKSGASNLDTQPRPRTCGEIAGSKRRLSDSCGVNLSLENGDKVDVVQGARDYVPYVLVTFVPRCRPCTVKQKQNRKPPPLSLLNHLRRMASNTLRKSIVHFGPARNSRRFAKRTFKQNVQRILTAIVSLLRNGGFLNGSNLMANEMDNDALQQELDTVFETARCSVSGQPFDVTESGADFPSLDRQVFDLETKQSLPYSHPDQRLSMMTRGFNTMKSNMSVNSWAITLATIKVDDFPTQIAVAKEISRKLDLFPHVDSSEKTQALVILNHRLSDLGSDNQAGSELFNSKLESFNQKIYKQTRRPDFGATDGIKSTRVIKRKTTRWVNMAAWNVATAKAFFIECQAVDCVTGHRVMPGDTENKLTFDRIVDDGLYEAANVIITSWAINRYKSKMLCFRTAKAFERYRATHYSEFSRLTRREMACVIIRAALNGLPPGSVCQCDEKEADSIRYEAMEVDP